MNTQNTELLSQISSGVHCQLSNDFGLIRATGEDARSFLHSQLTQDILHLSADEVRLAGYCSAKGRMYAVFYVWLSDDAVYLLTHRSVIDTVMKRLRMFVLRAKVVLEDVSGQFAITGYIGSDVLPNQVKQTDEKTTRLGILPASLKEWLQADAAREIRITPLAQFEAVEFADPQLWSWLDIMAGVAHVRAEISEAFVPQMMNLDRIGGVNFKKGCYPGQEIVARSHYLGKLKRRMQAASMVVETAPALVVGMDVYSTLDAREPAGQLLAFAPNPLVAQRWDVLYEVSLPMLAEGAQIYLKDIAAQWQSRPLPYLLQDA